MRNMWWYPGRFFTNQHWMGIQRDKHNPVLINQRMGWLSARISPMNSWQKTAGMNCLLFMCVLDCDLVAWCHLMSFDVISCHFMSFGVIWCHLVFDICLHCGLTSSISVFAVLLVMWIAIVSSSWFIAIRIWGYLMLSESRMPQKSPCLSSFS